MEENRGEGFRGVQESDMRARKVAIVSNSSFSLFKFRLGLMRELVKKGYDVLVVAPKDEYVGRIEAESLKFTHLNLTRSGINPLTEFKSLLQIMRIYLNEKPNVVLHFRIKPNVYGSFAAKLTGTKCINVVTGLGYAFTHNQLKAKVARAFYGISSKLAEKVVFQNHGDYEEFLKRGFVNDFKAEVIKGSGVDTEHFHPDFPLKFMEDKAKVTFTLISRMLWEKGVKEFVESAKVVRKKYPNTRFWLLGPLDTENPEGIPENILRRWHEEGVAKYLGIVDDVRPFISSSDVIVLPSYYGEGVPKSLLEAASMEKPIITTDWPGCREVVRDGVNGFLVPPKDSKALANAMMKMVEVEDFRRKMGKEGRRIILREFEEKEVLKRYIELIKGLG
jgi:glycosyltransferase involved in cell wall biosynthesis